jgi:hypothetical protein
MQMWDKAQHRFRWVQHTEVEPLQEGDGAVFVVANDGHCSVNDLRELSAEAAERRHLRSGNKPTIAPRADYIKEACDQLFFRNAVSWQVGEQSFHRPSVGMLIPRDAAWANAMADEARREWR